ncbi:MAG: putative ADP-ribose pyrophosphatase, partial [Actinomycetota bacterium]
EAPDGERFTRDIVRSPGAVAAVPLRFRADGTPYVTLVRQYRAPYDAMVIEIPAGMRDVQDEPTELTAARELIEEVGLDPGRLEFLHAMYPSAGMTDSVLHLFLATQLTEVPRETHGPEEAHMDVLHVDLADAVEMVLRGEIHDAKTVIGLLMVERRLREGAHG